MPDEELEPLLARARQREPEALAHLCSRLYPRILKYMHYRFHTQDAEDLTEEVLLRVLRGIDGQSGFFMAWLYRIAGNVAAEWHRKNAIRRRVQANEEVIGAASSGEADPADVVARRMDLAEAIEQLTDEQREFVTLKFIQGLPNDVIAESTARTPGAVRVLQFRALAALRAIMGAGSE